MARLGRIQRVFDTARQIPVNDNSKLVIFSDCHRGDGDGVDNFASNHNAYDVALRSYFAKGFTYIELGDGDELWVNSRFRPIVRTYSCVFKQLMKFHDKGRLYLIYGNHDSIKKNRKWVAENLHCYYDPRLRRIVPMLPKAEVHEGLVLHYEESGGKILLLHGHQADFFNDTLAPLAKFLVRYVWRPLEAIGVKDPTSASVNGNKKLVVEHNLISWVEKTGHILIAGHTHRSMFPVPGESAYFNDGCCVYPHHITALEIESGLISLVKWSVNARSDGVLQVCRDVVAGPYALAEYFPAAKTDADGYFLVA